jgi:di/tricarboxylate transporter
MLQRVHMTIGLLAVLVFVISGQIMAHHKPAMHELGADVRMMYLSRHVYLLGAALVNLILGIYLRLKPRGPMRVLQQIGSVLIVLSPFLLLSAFLSEPDLGLAGRSWKSLFGIVTLFGGTIFHWISAFGSKESKEISG